MEYTITGSLCEVYNVRNITDRFRKREFVIVRDETKNMKGYTNEQFIKFQLEQSKVLDIDVFKIGDELTITFDIRGNKTETGQYFTNLRALKIELSFCSPAITKIGNAMAGKQKFNSKVDAIPSDTRLLDPHDDMGIPTLPF